MTTITRYPGVKATSGTGPKLELLSNLVSNPRAALGTSGFTVMPGTGGAATSSAVPAGGPLPSSPSFHRGAWSAAQTGTASVAEIRNADPATQPLTEALVYVFRVYVRASYAAVVQPVISWRSATAFLATRNGAAITLTPGVWTPITTEGPAPAGTTRAQLNVNPTLASPLVPAGATIDTAAWMLYEKLAGAPAVAAYGDGDLGGWEWLGAPHASPSRGYGSLV